MNSSVHAFVDEYGDTSIEVEKRGVTRYFIITAVLVPDDLETMRIRADEIRRKFFQTGEIKSSSVGKDDGRRLKILEEISELGVRTYSLAIDKAELQSGSGLSYKRSFFKYLNKRLYEKIHRVYENVSLVADEHGGTTFMKGFESYLSREFPPSLFAQRSFTFAKSHEEVLLQVADFLSGTLARCLDPEKLSPDSKVFLGYLSKMSVGVEIWPPRSLPFPCATSVAAIDESHDELIRNHCIRQIQLFLNEHSVAPDDDDSTFAQLEVLRYLLFQAQFVDELRFVSTDEIIRHLETDAGMLLSKFQVRSAVIAKLRDADVILASGREGYKVPVCEEDINQFISHSESIVIPMLARLRRARKDLLMVSHGRLDILGSKDRHRMKALVDADETASMTQS